jgi:hypothetical protein
MRYIKLFEDKPKPIEPKKNFFQRVKSRLFEERLFESSELYWNISFNDINQGDYRLMIMKN